MRRPDSSILMVFVLVVAGLLAISCKDDEPEKFNLTFNESTQSALESDLEIKIEVKLDKPAPEDITINFELSGTALDDVSAGEDNSPDYEVDGEYDEIVVKQGETSATIKLVPYSDVLLEEDETIIVTVTEVDNENVIFDATQISTVTLKQEDGVVVLLEWPNSNSTDGFVDMDMFVRIGETASSYNFIINASINESFDIEFEACFIPKTYVGTNLGLNYTNSTYGMTYTYYDGTRNNLAFTVTFIDVINGDLEPVSSRRVDTGNYTLANLNKWTTTVPTIIAQTFRNVGGTYQDFSLITTPTSSSRTVATTQEFIKSLYRPSKSNSLRHYTLPERYRSQF